MTATDELRRLLDGRGVECWDMKTRGVWFGINGREHRFEAHEQTDGLIEVSIYDLTPAQAVEATLGRGTCHITVEDNLAETEGMGDVWLECSACHWQMPLEPTMPRFGYCPPRFSYCPSCGAKVVDA